MRTHTSISRGIYDPPTAARLLLAGRMAEEVYPIASRTLIRWIRSGLATPGLAETPGAELLLNFEDLVSLRVIAALRSYGVSWGKIRAAERWLREETEYARPFAREEMWTDGSQVLAGFRGHIIAASRHGQLAMDVIREHLIPISGLTFKNRLVKEWKPATLIVLDPKVQFGEPCIEGTRIPARAVWSLVRGGDSPEAVKAGYRLSREEFAAALAWGERVAA